jgi:Family of unknown function (DUF5372)
MRHVRKQAHNAGCLAFDTVVTYPFHPLVGQTVLVVGGTEHAGARHLIVRKSDGAAFHIPAWMTAPEATSIQLRADPRLPVNQLFELRILLDRLMALSIVEQIHDGGRNDTLEGRNRRSLRDTTAQANAAGTTKSIGNQASYNAAGGSTASFHRARHSRKRV